jgi:hypothetical protein
VSAFPLVCVIGCLGGLLLIRALYARKIARSRGVRFADVAWRTLLLRDEDGGWRRFVIGWIVVWLAVWVVGTTR